MDFDLSEEQEMLQKVARDFLTTECPTTVVREIIKDDRGYSPDLWRKMAELGWMGLIFPQQYGGEGAQFLDLVVLLTEMGRACVPSPFFSTVVLGGMTILEIGNEAQKQELLPAVARGDTIVTLASTEAIAKYSIDGISVTANAEGDGYFINGTKLFVPDALVADYIICVATTGHWGENGDGITLFLVDAESPGLDRSVLKTVAGDKQCAVVFNKVKVSAEYIVGEPGHGWCGIQKLLPKFAVAKCAEMIGGAQRILEMTVDYAKQRVQFGRPIGSFQAIQHHCANMATEVDISRLLTYQAAWMISEGLPHSKQAAAAKAWVSEAYSRVAALGHQVMAGVAFMEDHDMPLYFKRTKGAEAAFGDADFHRETIAKEIGL